MKIGIGSANLTDARASGRTVAEGALDGGSIDRPDLVLAFCSGGLAHAEFFEGLQAVFGRRVPIIAVRPSVSLRLTRSPTPGILPGRWRSNPMRSAAKSQPPTD